MKNCACCFEDKDDTEFYVLPSRGGRLSSYCKTCSAEKQKVSVAKMVARSDAYRSLTTYPSKVCPTCGIHKDAGDFYQNKSRLDGLTYECKECSSASAKARFQRIKMLRESGYLSTAESRVCSKCCERKDRSEFHVNVSALDGLHSACKQCEEEYVCQYRKSDARAESLKRYQSSDKFREVLKRYQSSMKFIEVIERYETNNPEKKAAHTAVNHAVEIGRLIKPNECEGCGCASKRLEGHHEDYSRQLDVIWLCKQCHVQLHLERKKHERNGRPNVDQPEPSSSKEFECGVHR